MTYDNYEEIRKIKKHAPHAGLALRIKVPNTGAMVELSSKFGAAPGEAVDLIVAADEAGLVVEGLSFHVGSQTTNFENYVQALNLAAGIFKEARDRGYTKMKLLDIGGGFPAPYDDSVKPFRELAQHHQPRARPALPEEHRDPGRAGPVPGGHRRHRRRQDHRQGRARRQALLLHRRRRLSHLLGLIFDHCQYHLKAFKNGPTQICAVFGPTCDALDMVSLAEELPGNLELGDLLYSENIGAYSHASSTYFNGFPPAKVVHVNQ